MQRGAWRWDGGCSTKWPSQVFDLVPESNSEVPITFRGILPRAIARLPPNLPPSLCCLVETQNPLYKNTIAVQSTGTAPGSALVWRLHMPALAVAPSRVQHDPHCEKLMAAQGRRTRGRWRFGMISHGAQARSACAVHRPQPAQCPSPAQRSLSPVPALVSTMC